MSYTRVAQYNWKSPVNTTSDLPTSANSVGDVRVVISPLSTYQWDGSTWNTFGSGGGGSVAWGSITGTLSNQLDLQSALNAKAPTASPTFTGTVTLPTGLTGVVHAASGVVSASNVNLASEVTGVLPVANGGTNSSTSLNNNRVIISSSSKIVEASAITASKALASDANGLPVAVSNLSASNLDLLNNLFAANATFVVGATAGTSTIKGASTNGGTDANFMIFSGGDYTGTSGDRYAGDCTVKAGNSSANTSNAGSVYVQGGNATGTGNPGGYVFIQAGTSSHGTAGQINFLTAGSTRGIVDENGKWTIGASGGTQIHRINGATVSAGSDLLTFTNGPTGTAGNPDIYLELNISGTNYVFPGFAV